MQDVPSTLTMQDIADLARVQRPTVSMWRKRTRARGRHLPFPNPVSVVGGVEHFARDAIVAWLDATGRGNNAEFRYDAPAFSVPDAGDLEELVLLLCLHTLTGEQLDGLSHDRLIALASEIDPNDEFALHEMREARLNPSFLRFVDDLVEASYGPDDALARLETGRLKRRQAQRGLTHDVVEILRVSAQACREHLNRDDVVLVHGGDPALSFNLAVDFPALVVSGDEPDDRAIRRRALIAGHDTTPVATKSSVTVTSVVGLDVEVALERIDEVVIELGHDNLAVILGSAPVLCDQLRGEHDQRRADTLRLGHLVMAARLPRGLWRTAHRQNLGLWMLHGGSEAQQLWVADLAVVPNGELDFDDLNSDIFAALGASNRRAYRYARVGDLPPILAGGPVVPPGVRAIRMGRSAAESHLEQVHAATLVTSLPLGAFDVLVEPAPGSIVLQQQSLAQLRAAGQVAMKRGTRLKAEHASDDGTVAVLTADGSWDGRRLDPFDAVEHYPRATRTESGDVVFREKPFPLARVDIEGGALVASPSRILRLGPTARIGPYALAAVINEQQVLGSEWETWSIPLLKKHEAQALDETLRDAHKYGTELQRRMDATRNLTKALIDGVAAGTITVDAKPTIGIHS